MTNVHPLTSYRARNRLSLEDLGRLVGVSRVTVYRWETRERLPKPAHAAKLVRITGIPLVKWRPDMAGASLERV